MTNEVTTRLGVQEAAVKSLEDQFSRSSSSIGNAARGLVATLATLFTGRELVGMIDSFTRLQNSLRVAGLEGSELESVQSRLLELSKQYGVSIEELAGLYGKSAQAASELGASEAQLLQITEASAQALKITGTSAAQAQGALLGLTQALASGTVRAEEFNQINEGGLRPLLQVAANAEKYGGSVAKLRTAVVDGKVSSQEFYQAILSGSAQLEGQASKAVLTLAGAYEAFNSALTVYVGQSAQANGATNALAGGLQTLAENLDTLVNVLAVLATFIAGRYVGALAGAAGAALAAARANVILSAAAAGAGTQLQVLGVRAALTGRALLAAFGGPVGLAVTALTLGIGALALASRDTAASLGELEGELAVAEGRLADARQQAKAAGIDVERLGSNSTVAANSISTFTGAVWASVEAMTSAASAAKQLTLAKIALSSAEARSTIAELAPRARSDAAGLRGAAALGSSLLGSRFDKQDIAELNETSARLNVAAATLRANDETVRIINALGGKFQEPGGAGSTAAAATDTAKKKKAGRGRSGPSEADIEARFNQELANLAQQTLSARQALATSAEDRAELELRSVELARAAALDSLEAEKNYSEAQKARIRDALENLAEFERERVQREKRLQLEQEAADLADAEFRARSDALRQQYDLARSQAERRRLAFEIIDLEYQERDAALERIKNNKDLNDAVRQRAAIEQAALRDGRGLTMEQARRDTAGPLENYFDRAKMDAEELNEAYQQVAVDGLGSVTNALAETATGFLKLGGVAGRVIDGIISDLIRLFIQQQITGLIGNLFGAASGGGGSFGSSGGVGLPTFGRASGGYVAPGQTVRVNEHRGGAEYLRMGSQGGEVIPLGRVNQMAAQPVSARQGPIELRVYADRGAFISDVEAISEGQAVKVTMAAAGPLTERAVQETMRRANRPRMPGAGR